MLTSGSFSCAREIAVALDVAQHFFPVVKPNEMPEGFSLTGQATQPPTFDFTPKTKRKSD